MKKLLLVVDSRHPSQPAMEYACWLANYTHSQLAGLFIENLYSESIPIGGVEGPWYYGRNIPQGNQTLVRAEIDKAVSLFKEVCSEHAVSPQICIDAGEPIQQTLFESRFADLLLLDPVTNCHGTQDILPSHFSREILANSACPVLLTPDLLKPADEVIFCYDGSPSAVFAIRQFTYILPEFSQVKAVLLEVNHSGKVEFNDAHKRMMEWLKDHYQTVTYQALMGQAKDELFTHLFMKTGKLIVMGAYGRSLLSNFFRKSQADVLIKTIDLPLFITHI